MCNIRITYQPDAENLHANVELDGPRAMRQWPADAHVPVDADHTHVHDARGAAENVREAVQHAGGEVKGPVACKTEKIEELRDAGKTIT